MDWKSPERLRRLLDERCAYCGEPVRCCETPGWIAVSEPIPCNPPDDEPWWCSAICKYRATHPTAPTSRTVEGHTGGDVR